MDERKRDSMIVYLRHRMDDFGISPDDLASFLATPSLGADTGRYRSAGGDTWSGEGEMPQWLKQATDMYGPCQVLKCGSPKFDGSRAGAQPGVANP
jgi:hypothetical protein